MDAGEMLVDLILEISLGDFLVVEKRKHVLVGVLGGLEGLGVDV